MTISRQEHVSKGESSLPARKYSSISAAIGVALLTLASPGSVDAQGVVQRDPVTQSELTSSPKISEDISLMYHTIERTPQRGDFVYKFIDENFYTDQMSRELILSNLMVKNPHLENIQLGNTYVLEVSNHLRQFLKSSSVFADIQSTVPKGLPTHSDSLQRQRERNSEGEREMIRKEIENEIKQEILAEMAYDEKVLKQQELQHQKTADSLATVEQLTLHYEQKQEQKQRIAEAVAHRDAVEKYGKEYVAEKKKAEQGRNEANQLRVDSRVKQAKEQEMKDDAILAQQVEDAFSASRSESMSAYFASIGVRHPSSVPLEYVGSGRQAVLTNESYEENYEYLVKDFKKISTIIASQQITIKKMKKTLDEKQKFDADDKERAEYYFKNIETLGEMFDEAVDNNGLDRLSSQLEIDGSGYDELINDRELLRTKRYPKLLLDKTEVAQEIAERNRALEAQGKSTTGILSKLRANGENQSTKSSATAQIERLRQFVAEFYEKYTDIFPEFIFIKTQFSQYTNGMNTKDYRIDAAKPEPIELSGTERS